MSGKSTKGLLPLLLMSAIIDPPMQSLINQERGKFEFPEVSKEVDLATKIDRKLRRQKRQIERDTKNIAITHSINLLKQKVHDARRAKQ